MGLLRLKHPAKIFVFFVPPFFLILEQMQFTENHKDYFVLG